MSESSDITVDPGGSNFYTSTQKAKFDINNFSTEVIVNGSFMDANWAQGISPIRNESGNMFSPSNTNYERDFPNISRASVVGGGQKDDLSTTQTEESIAYSQVQSNIIIIEPTGTDHEIRAFFNNDLNIAKGLDNSIIKQLGISKVRKNMSRKILIVEHKPQGSNIVEKALQLKKIGNYNVHCRLPVLNTKTYGVIGPVGLDTDLEALQTSLLPQCETIDKVERITKGKDKTNTVFLKITFNQPALPKFLYVGYQRLPVKTYISTPWQCYKCQGFGHNAQHCRFKPRCLVCSGAHQYKDCPHKGSTFSDPKCPNCHGKHAANFGGCPSFKKAKQVERVRCTEKISYRDALKVINQEEANPNKNASSPLYQSHRTINSSPSMPPSSDSSSISGINTPGSPKPPLRHIYKNKIRSSSQVSMISSSSQTNESIPCNQKCQEKSQCFDKEALLKEISKVIYQIVSSPHQVSQNSVNDLVQKKIGKILNPPQAATLVDKDNLPPPDQKSSLSGKQRTNFDPPPSSQDDSIIPPTPPVEPLLQLTTPNRNRSSKKEAINNKRKSTGSRSNSPKKKPPPK